METEQELTREQLSVGVALARATGRRIYDTETIKVHEALLRGGWTFHVCDPIECAHSSHGPIYPPGHTAEREPISR
jgi:hypothetical protein